MRKKRDKLSRWLAVLVTAISATVGSTAFAADDWVASARGGNWSDSATWSGGKVPAAGARVHVKPGHLVVYDVKSARCVGATCDR